MQYHVVPTRGPMGRRSKLDNVKFTGYVLPTVPRAALSQEQIDAFRDRAITAATGLFADLGYDAVTMRALANKLGCSPMTAYRYFENKSELFAQVRREAFTRFADRQCEAGKGLRGAKRLSHLGQTYVEFALDDPGAYRIMFELEQPPSGDYPDLDAEVARSFSYLHDATVEAVADGDLHGDPLTLAHLMWARVHGIVSLHLAGKLVMGRSLRDLIAAGTAFAPHGVPTH
jgi:AcrR family transcriptional regulator